FLTVFLFHYSVKHLYLHSFPTRRSSDLLKSSMAQPLVKNTGWETRVAFLPAALSCCSMRAALPTGAGVTMTSMGGLCANSAIRTDRKSTRLNSSHVKISYAVFCLKKKKK